MARLIAAYPGAQIDLVGHSLGGVVAAYWAATYGRRDGVLGHIHSLITFDSPVRGLHGLIATSPPGQFFGISLQQELNPKTSSVIRLINDRSTGTVASLPGRIFTVANLLDEFVVHCDATLDGARVNKVVSMRAAGSHPSPDDLKPKPIRVYGCASGGETFVKYDKVRASPNPANHGTVLEAPGLLTNVVKYWIQPPIETQRWPADGLSPAWISCSGRVFKTGARPEPTRPFLSASTKITVGSFRRRWSGTASYVGFALYRTWATPHWVQIEQASSSIAGGICSGPWDATNDGRGAEYVEANSLSGNTPSGGTYYLALLWSNDGYHLQHPHGSLSAQLSRKSITLAATHAFALWDCTGAPPNVRCSSQYFDLFG